jgi:hypothetical protein
MTFYSGEYGRDGSLSRLSQNHGHRVFRRESQTLTNGIIIISRFYYQFNLFVLIWFQLIGSTLTYVAILHQVASHSK